MMRVAAALLLMLPFAVNAAEVFKCVTENGVVRYSDAPCADGRTERLDIESAPTDSSIAEERARERKEKIEAFDKADAESAKAAADAAKKKEEREAQCKSARERLDSMMMERRMYTEKDGQREYLSSEDIVRRREEQRDKVAELCGS